MIDFETLKKTARTKGITNIGYAEKDYFQEIILLGISREVPGLLFKGGTALYKLHGLNRFSEDLDFTGNIENRDIRRIAEYIRNFGYETDVSVKNVKSGKLMTFKVKGFLYQGTAESLARVQMDVNTESQIDLEPEWLTLFSIYPGIPSYRLKVMTLTEIMAEKIRALLVRRKVRDAYDIWFLMNKGIKVNVDLVGKKLEYYDIKPDKMLLDSALEICKKNWKKELRPVILDLPEYEDVAKKIRQGIPF